MAGSDSRNDTRPLVQQRPEWIFLEQNSDQVFLGLAGPQFARQGFMLRFTTDFSESEEVSHVCASHFGTDRFLSE